MWQKPWFVIAVMIFLLTIMGGVAYYFGNQQGVQQAEAKYKPVKKFRAKEGTERENAQALTSSQRGMQEEKGEGTMEVMGSLERPDQEEPKTRTEQAISDALNADTPEEGIRTLLDRLKSSEDHEQQALIYAALAAMYRALDPPMHDEAERALEYAWKHAETPEEKAEVAYSQASYDLAQGDFEAVLETMSRVQDVELPPSDQSLELGVMMGVAYEQLGMNEDAQAAYEGIMEQAQQIGLGRHESVANVYRQAGMNLAMLYRRAGEESKAQQLAREVRSNLASY